jgi:uncharacterized protein (UPF0333 family)
MKALRSLGKLEIGILILVILLASSVMAAWFVASERVTVSSTVVTLTAATYGKARSAQLQVETASIYWSCEPTVFTAHTTYGFTANPMTPIWLDSADKIRNFRAIRSGGSDAYLKVNYFE